MTPATAATTSDPASRVSTFDFVDTDEAARRALESAPTQMVIGIAVRAFNYGFVPILGGILMISTGLVDLLEDPLAPVSVAGAAFLAGGAMVYLLGVTALRQSVAAAGVTRWIAAISTAVACVIAWWLGTITAGLVELALLAVALLALTASTYPDAGRSRSTGRQRSVSSPR